MTRQRRSDAHDTDPRGARPATRNAAVRRTAVPGIWRRGAGIYALVLLIVVADWLTPAGIVVGILLGVPILLSSAGDSPREVVAVSVTCAVGFIAAAVFGSGPIAPEAVWLPNRLFAIVAIAASSVLALVLQGRRVDSEAARGDAESARAEAESARDLSRLLHSLMAHDLRSPLALARDTLGAIEQPLRAGTPVDIALIADVDARLGRSLRAIQLVLDSARGSLAEPDSTPTPASPVDINREILEEAASFTEEALARGKQLHTELPDPELSARLDPTILRQSVAILVDNAIRYAVPGPVWITVAVEGGDVSVRVRDSGPGLSQHRAQARVESGEGLGLKLCGLLVRRAGGVLAVARDGKDGTEFVLRLPAG